nr:helicase C-terminal domain-containing protein [uncultured Desulfuromonas sp.]
MTSVTENTTANYLDHCLESMRQAIKDAQGNELFFLGHTNENLVITDITILARGHRSAVPALASRCRSGDTVIHNHPSGNLTPSDADLAIAARLGETGIGFHIVDNSVDNVYKVVDAYPQPQDKSILHEAVGNILTTNGPLATHLGTYEERPEQLRMAFAVTDAFNQEGLATIEAGTGTGKSLAYLIPAILWALDNEQPVAVSTNTINLQEQLISKDLPLLKQVMDREFLAVLVKGRNNYLCLRRLDSAHREPDLFQREQSSELSQLHEWAANTHVGSRDELTFVPSSAVWLEVCCEMDQCPRTRCPHYNRCFFHKARRRASHADLLVVNHALLLSDLALRAQTENYSAAAVLPPYSRIVFDEAHHLEDAATRNFSIRLSQVSFSYSLNRLVHPRKPEKGLLPRLLSVLARELPDSLSALYDSLYRRIETASLDCRQLREDLGELFSRQRDKLQPANEATTNSGFSWRITADCLKTERWLTLQKEFSPLVKQCEQLSDQLDQLVKACDLLPEKLYEKIVGHLTDTRAMSGRIQGLGSDLAVVLSAGDNACTWIEISESRSRQKDRILWMNSAPISVAATLKQAVYDRFRSIVFTSATLTVNRQFHYFHQRTGLNLCSEKRRQQLCLDSPFDFAHQTLVAIPTDIVPPTHPDYAVMLAEQIEQAVISSEGRSFVLFTAYSLLKKLYNQLEPPLQAQGFHCLYQGQSARHLLLKKFCLDQKHILFGTDSFWEGVDVPGRALEQVIITRLPFRVPTEPIQIARSEHLEQMGIDPFMHYTVPQAVLRLKQGFGRLIRHRQDRGVVLILDQRVINKGYGRIFLNSLPPAQRLTGPTHFIQKQIRQFFSPDSAYTEE